MGQARRELPGGTVTLLFTDVEGSTRLLTEIGDRYAALLDDHRRRLRGAFRAHGGVEVDTQGDSFFYAFASARDALTAACEAQSAMAEMADDGLKVRIGLHTGEPMVTGEGYVGLDVHRAARIMGAGHGGQILLSQTTRDLVGDAADLRDLGEHRLKDLTAPQRLWQVGHDEFSPLRTLYQTNLPIQATPLIGRERELEEAGELLRQHRLLTMTGPGGSGKTRLALQVAADTLEEFPDGVWWIPLAAIGDPALVLPTIRQSLGISGDLAAALHQKRLLILLDNMEHVISSAASLAELLQATAHLKILATSREPLRIAGEHELPVEPMAEGEAVELFEQRAMSAEPRDAVLEICRRLDCLPLAVELAAARTALLPPPELLRRLDSRLAILTGGRRDAPDRQRTLRSTMEWSYELLTDAERRLFRRLAVFAGSFTLDAAEAVTDADLETLGSLIDKSLLRRWSTARFGMLATIAEFAGEKLAADPDADALHEAHAGFFIRLAEASIAARGVRRPDLMAAMEAEHDNLRAVLDWTSRTDRPELMLRMCAALADFWIYHSHLWEGRHWATQALAATDADDPDLETWRAAALHGLSVLSVQQGDWGTAEASSRERLVIGERLGDPLVEASAHLTLGRALLALGDADAARTHLEAAIERDAAAPTSVYGAMATFNLAYLALTSGEFDRARLLMVDARDRFAAMPDAYGEARTYTGLGAVAVHSGSLDEAVEPLREAIRRSAELATPEGIVWALELLGCALSESAPAEATRLLGAAEVQRERLGLKLEDAELAPHDRAVAAIDRLLGASARDVAWAEGRRLTLDEAVAASLAP